MPRGRSSKRKAPTSSNARAPRRQRKAVPVDESKADADAQPLRIHFMRHGHVNNPKQVYYGRLPRYRLSQRGLDQADEGAEYLFNLGIPDPSELQAIYVSPMLRARQTAKAVARRHAQVTKLGVPWKPQITPRLYEILTPGDGLEAAHLDKVGWERLYTLSAEKNAAGELAPGDVPYEEFHDVVARVEEAIRWARSKYKSGHVVFVSHGDCVLSARMIARSLPSTLKARADNRPALYMPTASIVTLLVSAEGDISEENLWSPTDSTLR